MTSREIERIDRITASVNDLLKGEIPPLLNVEGHTDDEIKQLSEFINRLISQEDNLMKAGLELSRGALDSEIESRLPAANSMKNLQASLRHLNWQTQRIATGDFSQRTDFLGVFSSAFNWMVEKLDANHLDMQNEIEKRRKAQITAEKANSSKSYFLANMSHELRTPLNHIIGFCQLVVDRRVGDLNQTQAEYLSDVLSSSRHLLSLVNDILDLSKIEADKLDLDLTSISVESLIDNSVSMVEEKANEGGISITLDSEGAPSEIRADERKLKQILFNLLSNAVKFSPDGGAIAVTAKASSVKYDGKDKAAIEFVIKDSGQGMTAEDISEIFKPFMRIENEQTRGIQGTGLGLSLTKRLVELHGGSISAESGGKDMGSTFRFTVPA